MLFLVIALRQFHGKNSLKKSSWLKGCAHCNIRRICYLTYITVLMITLIDWTWPSLHLFCVLKSFPCWIKRPTFCPSNCKNVFEIKQITPSLWLISYTVTPRCFPPLWSGSKNSENWSFKWTAPKSSSSSEAAEELLDRMHPVSLGVLRGYIPRYV